MFSRMRQTGLAKTFCNCIKKVRRTVKLRKSLGSSKEKAAIAICVKSVLGSRGKTLRKFRCRRRNKGPRLATQPPLK